MTCQYCTVPGWVYWITIVSGPGLGGHSHGLFRGDLCLDRLQNLLRQKADASWTHDSAACDTAEFQEILKASGDFSQPSWPPAQSIWIMGCLPAIATGRARSFPLASGRQAGALARYRTCYSSSLSAFYCLSLSATGGIAEAWVGNSGDQEARRPIKSPICRIRPNKCSAMGIPSR